MLVAAVGLVVAALTGRVEVDADLVTGIALAVFWFLLGYGFYAAAFAVAGAMVPRQEELQSTATPLTLLILVSLFLGFAVQGDPDGTLAHICAFIPTTAPVTMPRGAPTWSTPSTVARRSAGNAAANNAKAAGPKPACPTPMPIRPASRAR